jgi:hypothetical protein
MIQSFSACNPPKVHRTQSRLRKPRSRDVWQDQTAGISSKASAESQ